MFSEKIKFNTGCSRLSSVSIHVYAKRWFEHLLKVCTGSTLRKRWGSTEFSILSLNKIIPATRRDRIVIEFWIFSSVVKNSLFSHILKIFLHKLRAQIERRRWYSVSASFSLSIGTLCDRFWHLSGKRLAICCHSSFFHVYTWIDVVFHGFSENRLRFLASLSFHRYFLEVLKHTTDDSSRIFDLQSFQPTYNQWQNNL